MKRLWLVLLVILVAGCVTVNPRTQPDPVVVDLRIQGVDAVKVESGDTVSKSMEVENPAGELSGMTFIENNVGYIKIFSTISAGDAQNLWNDFCLFKIRGIEKVEIYINSGGGDAFAGMAISDQIERAKRQGIEVMAHASGVIASATVPIFAVCSKRYAAPGTIFMVHEAKLFKFFAEETKSDLKAQNDLMELLETNYLKKLADNSKLSVEEWRAHEKETTWFDVNKAIAWGLVDEVE